MSRRKLPQREVAGFLKELEGSGATHITRSPVGIDGLVEVQWGESDLERQQYAASVQAWRPAIILSAVFAAVVVAVLLAVAL